MNKKETIERQVGGSRPENLSLIECAQNGDKTALEQLVILNRGLVNSLALRFVGRGQETEDLIELGNLGLIKAIRTFDTTRGFAFSTYAVPLILGEIRRFLRDDGPIKVSREQKHLAARLARERDIAIAEGKGELHISELAKRCDISVEAATEALEAMSPVHSLSEPISAEDDSPALEVTLIDEENTPEKSFNILALRMAIDKLPEMRKKIILLRYFRNYSQQQTADQLGITQVRVSREEKRILEFLRKEMDVR